MVEQAGEGSCGISFFQRFQIELEIGIYLKSCPRGYPASVWGP